MSEPTLTELMDRQEELCEELSARLYDDGPIGKTIQHPLVHEISYHPFMNAVYNFRLQKKKEAIQQAIATKDWIKAVVLHERPWRINALHKIMLHGYIDDPAEYWPVLVEFWIDSENIHQNYDLWIDLWSAEDMGCPRQHGMGESELATLAALPEEITVYRTVACEEYANGLSWTLDLDVAIGVFARHPNVLVHRDGAKLITGKLRKDDVLVYLDTRDEAEIVVLPDTVEIVDVRDIEQTEIEKSVKVIRARRE